MLTPVFLIIIDQDIVFGEFYLFNCYFLDMNLAEKDGLVTR